MQFELINKTIPIASGSDNVWPFGMLLFCILERHNLGLLLEEDLVGLEVREVERKEGWTTMNKFVGYFEKKNTVYILASRKLDADFQVGRNSEHHTRMELEGQC